MPPHAVETNSLAGFKKGLDKFLGGGSGIHGELLDVGVMAIASESVLPGP